MEEVVNEIKYKPCNRKLSSKSTQKAMQEERQSTLTVLAKIMT